MGSFFGHALPGSMFFLFGVWWTIQVMRRYFMSRQSGKPFRSSATFPCDWCSGRRMRKLPIEGIVKIVLCVVGIIVEFIGGYNEEKHKFDDVGNGQHITMYSFFLLSGVLDILTSRGIAPAGCDYFGIMVALVVEGTLFKYHLYGRSTLDILIHELLLYVILLTVVVLLVENFKRNDVFLPMLRTLLLLLQGTWFWAVGIILYNPNPKAEPWDQEDHHSLMLAVICFCWHVAVNMTLMFLVGGVMAFCYRGRQTTQYSRVPMKRRDEEEEVMTALDIDLADGNSEGKGQGLQ